MTSILTFSKVAGDRSLLAEGDDGYGEGEGGDDELCNVDPESCLDHSATVSLAVAGGIR